MLMEAMMTANSMELLLATMQVVVSTTLLTVDQTHLLKTGIGELVTTTVDQDRGPALKASTIRQGDGDLNLET